MKKFYDVIIIGGGAAGMMAAITAAGNKKKVLVIEHKERLGKKILATGNGRCNLTNYKMDSSCYGRENAGFAMNVIEKFDEKAVCDFFVGMGMLLHDRNGYVYPNSDQASVVSEMLQHKMFACNVTVITETTVFKILREDKFIIKTNNGVYEGTNVILATGSKASPKTGSDGSGYILAKSLGHTIKEPLPALTSLQSDYKLLKQCAGVRCDGIVTLLIDGSVDCTERGEIQMTDYGISGIPVFQISRYAVSAVAASKKVVCELDFLPDFDEEFVKKMIMSKIGLGLCAEDIFLGLVNKKISNMLLKVCGIEPAAKKVGEKDICNFIRLIKHFKINITGYNSFDYGQVCQGGVSLDEINPDTMESTIVPGLYFAGELVDVDGICGGYNLQWAWSSGHLAGEVLSK